MPGPLASLVVSVGANLQGFEKGMTSVSSNLRKLGAGLQEIGTNLTLAVTLPVTAAIKKVTDYEAALREAEAVTRGEIRTNSMFANSMDLIASGSAGVAARMKMEDELFRRVSVDKGVYVTDATQVAQAMSQMIKQGLGMNEMISNYSEYMAGTVPLQGAFKTAVDLSAASTMSLTEAGDSVIKVMRTFGIDTKTAAGTIDFLVRAANASTMSIEDVFGALAQVGPTLKGFGFTAEDAGVALALLSQRGIQSEEAGTTLKSMLINLTKQTKPTQAAMRDLGFDIYNSAGEMLPFATIVGLLNEKLGENATILHKVGGATKEDADLMSKYAMKIGNARSEMDMINEGGKDVNMTEKARANRLKELTANIAYYSKEMTELTAKYPAQAAELVKLTDKQKNFYAQKLAGTYGQKALWTLISDPQEWDRMVKSIGGATNLFDLAGAKTQSFQYTIDKLKASVFNLSAEAFLPLITNTLQPLVSNVSDALNSFNRLNPSVVQVAGKVLLLLAVLGPVLFVLGRLVSSVGAAIKIFQALGGAVTLGMSAIGGLLGLLGTLGSVLLGPIGLLLALGIAMFAVATGSTDAGKLLSAFGTTVRGLSSKVGAGLEKMFPGLGVKFERLKVDVTKGSKSVITALQANLTSALGPVGMKAVDEISKWKLWSGIDSALGGSPFAGAYNSLKKFAQELGILPKDKIISVNPRLTPDYAGLATTATSAANVAGTSFMDAIQKWPLFVTMKAKWAEVQDAIYQTPLKPVFDFAGAFVSGFTGQAGLLEKQTKNALVNPWELGQNVFPEDTSSLGYKIGVALKDGLETAKPIVETGIKNLVAAMEGLPKWLTDRKKDWDSFSGAAAEGFKGAVTAVTAGSVELKKALDNAGLTSALSEFMKGLNIPQKIQILVEFITGEGVDKLRQAQNDLVNPWELGQNVYPAVTGPQRMGDSFGAALDSATTKIGPFAEAIGAVSLVNLQDLATFASELGALKNIVVTSIKIMASMLMLLIETIASLIPKTVRDMIFPGKIDMKPRESAVSALDDINSFLEAVLQNTYRVREGIRGELPETPLRIEPQHYIPRAAPAGAADEQQGPEFTVDLPVVFSVPDQAKADLTADIRSTISDASIGIVAYNAGANISSRMGAGIISESQAVATAMAVLAGIVASFLPNSPDARQGPLSNLSGMGSSISNNLAAGIEGSSGSVRNAMDGLTSGADFRGPSQIIRRSTSSGSSSSSPGQLQSINVNINNPTGEPSEVSVLRQLRIMSAIGILNPLAKEAME